MYPLVAFGNKRKRGIKMFDLKKFEAMLLNHNYTKQQVADYLGITLTSLYRRLEKFGEFKSSEIRKLITVFSKEEVLNCLFYYA